MGKKILPTIVQVAHILHLLVKTRNPMKLVTLCSFSRWGNQATGFRVHLLPPTPKGSEPGKKLSKSPGARFSNTLLTASRSRCDFYFSFSSVRAIKHLHACISPNSRLLYYSSRSVKVATTAPVSCFLPLPFCRGVPSLRSLPPTAKAQSLQPFRKGQETMSALLPTEAPSSDCSLPAFATLDSPPEATKNSKEGSSWSARWSRPKVTGWFPFLGGFISVLSPQQAALPTWGQWKQEACSFVHFRKVSKDFANATTSTGFLITDKSKKSKGQGAKLALFFLSLLQKQTKQSKPSHCSRGKMFQTWKRFRLPNSR